METATCSSMEVPTLRLLITDAAFRAREVEGPPAKVPRPNPDDGIEDPATIATMKTEEIEHVQCLVEKLALTTSHRQGQQTCLQAGDEQRNAFISAAHEERRAGNRNMDNRFEASKYGHTVVGHVL
ncbi:hypothetical protein NDU88_000989 [Pleurodeles waltl]|uniref:Uncharacterized protein n=1 Tax=Pleurodeles waltl TaxID=8319 RepID=A0AAV7L861_PLEWA|nr:hypothetical protein NDU88_000989 [Pleurodeles waltl]